MDVALTNEFARASNYVDASYPPCFIVNKSLSLLYFLSMILVIELLEQVDLSFSNDLSCRVFHDDLYLVV